MEHGEANGLSGRIFYSDGTAVHEEIKVEVDVSRPGDEVRYRSSDLGGHSRDDGRFLVPIPGGFAPAQLKIYVKGDRVEPSRMHWAGRHRVFIVMPKLLGRGGGDQGGLITGKVLGEDGRPAPGAKIEAQVISGSMLGFLSPKFARTKAAKGGRFALEFDGGTELKNLTVDGNQLAGARRRTKDGEERDVEVSKVSAGTFNLTLVKEKKFLGLW